MAKVLEILLARYACARGNGKIPFGSMHHNMVRGKVRVKRAKLFQQSFAPIKKNVIAILAPTPSSKKSCAANRTLKKSIK